jgi:hypothetical protein
MRQRLRILIAVVVATLWARTGSLAVQVAGGQMHTVLVVNHTNACIKVRMFRNEAREPTTPPMKQRNLAPRARFSVTVAELPKEVWVEADVMSDSHCTDTKVSAYMAGYARGGGVIVTGKIAPKYVFVAMPIKDVPPQ